MGAADLPGMLEDDDRERLFVSGIVHKAVIEVAACTTRDLCELGLLWYVAASSGALGLYRGSSFCVLCGGGSVRCSSLRGARPTRS
jgi:hypothetical protein